MGEAPERIYLDGDVEAGDGMFPRCFESQKYASEPQVEYVRSDRIEELEAKLAEAVARLSLPEHRNKSSSTRVRSLVANERQKTPRFDRGPERC